MQTATSAHGKMSSQLRIRLSLRELEKPENAQRKNDFLKAWKLIKELPADDPDSFWTIASYHGMPWKERKVDPFDDKKLRGDSWNGYCQHGNILFPTWHRFYCLRIEEALQNAVPDGDVALHYWDETSDDNLISAIPPILSQETVSIDGVDVPNPLHSFKFPQAIEAPPPEDDLSLKTKYYVKPEGYVTVRYPFSGIMNPDAAKAAADKHNEEVRAMGQAPVELFKRNMLNWLKIGSEPVNEDYPNSCYYEFLNCLNESSYNKFSNNSSAVHAVNLERAHDQIHLAVGGFTAPEQLADGSVELDEHGDIKHFGLIKGANGDMGANETASFDPIFHLHHSNIDRMFWVWQKKYHHENNIPLDQNHTDVGLTNHSQGPTPFQIPEQKLNFSTILHPFEDKRGLPRKSLGCIDIRELGYDYSIGSLDQKTWPVAPVKHQYVELTADTWDDFNEQLQKKLTIAQQPLKAVMDMSFFSYPPFLLTRPSAGERFNPMIPPLTQFGDTKFEVQFTLSVKNINRNSIPGSFVVQAYVMKEDGKAYFIGQKGVLDRWDRKRCANCLGRPKTAVGFSVNHVFDEVHSLTNLLIQIVYSDPDCGELRAIPLTKFGEIYNSETLAAARAADKETIHLVAAFKQR